ncbi:uncharacterized protein LOC111300229 isoform X2 [Durio zibethinus]|uniref:Uncharacterized protein LOC111300229 isoform X2 n=1 Tax=Durio zibethinus TaxID=66656 RepID=A0A6P5ZGH8_DURZI|nr:uncharacterized protein LOC111300229 isoform X2 [Durio zibethinus]
MASACVNNIGVSPESFQPTTSYSTYSWLSPRISLSQEEESSKSRPKSPADPSSKDPLPDSDPPEIQDTVAGDFEFRLDEDPVTMLPADELFSDGKLVPLHFSTLKQHPPVNALSEIRSPETAKSCHRIGMEISGTDPYLFSPKAPRCSSRWRELLGLKKFSHYTNQPPKSDSQSKISLLSNNNPKSLKHFLNRNSKSSSSTASWADSTLSLPLLKDSDCESLSISSSRLSLSSSSSGHEHEDLPRLSLDTDKPSLNNPSPNPFAPCRNINPNPPRMRIFKPRPGSSVSDTNQTAAGGTRMERSPIRMDSSGGVTIRGVSVDSPRMNSSGKIVFHNLERSSSSPSSFNGGPRFKQRGMERSYSVPFNFFSTKDCKWRKQQRASG